MPYGVFTAPAKKARQEWIGWVFYLSGIEVAVTSSLVVCNTVSSSPLVSGDSSNGGGGLLPFSSAGPSAGGKTVFGHIHFFPQCYNITLALFRHISFVNFGIGLRRYVFEPVSLEKNFKTHAFFYWTFQLFFNLPDLFPTVHQGSFQGEILWKRERSPRSQSSLPGWVIFLLVKRCSLNR